jgi:hypothetical protein
MDIYLFSAIANVVWYCFTVIFLLYKFTSFFSYVYKFIIFSGRLFTGVSWVSNKIYSFIMYRKGYSNTIKLEESTSLLADDEEYNRFNENPLFLEKLKNKIWKQKPYVQNEQLYELHVSNFNSVPDFKIETPKNSQLKKAVQFDVNTNSFQDTKLHPVPSGISYSAKPIEIKEHLTNSNILFDSEFINKNINLPFAVEEERQTNT